jgi:allophanate hydrolase subunit 1
MIYPQPICKPGGDRAVEVELGDEMSFDLNFLVHTLAGRIREAALPGVIELIPEMSSIQVSYDPDGIGYGDLVAEIAGLYASLGDLSALELPSRLYYVPEL